MTPLPGKTAIVTGASRGMGRSTALEFAAGEGSAVVLLSSLTAHAAAGTLAARAAARGRVDMLVKHFVVALGGRGIRVNAVAPGVVATDISSFAKTAGG